MWYSASKWQRWKKSLIMATHSSYFDSWELQSQNFLVARSCRPSGVSDDEALWTVARSCRPSVSQTTVTCRLNYVSALSSVVCCIISLWWVFLSTVQRRTWLSKANLPRNNLDFHFMISQQDDEHAAHWEISQYPATDWGPARVVGECCGCCCCC